MHLRLVREILAADYTHGSLYVDGLFECFTLEDAVRGDGIAATVAQWKKPKITAIPYDNHTVIINFSTRFQRLLPLLEGVKGFSGVRIHKGNTKDNTEGCILVGQARSGAEIVNSKKAFDPLFEKMQDAIGRGDIITMEITR